MSDARFPLKDRAELLIAAGAAAEALEQRCDEATGLTVTIARDELAEISEQFQRVTALLTLVHMVEAKAAKAAQEREVA